MRILVATDQWFPDVSGGVARVARDTSLGLAARGHEVTVIAPSHGSTSGGAVEEGGVTVVKALRRTRLPQSLTDPRDTATVARAMGSRFDVLVAHNSTTATGLARSRLGVPIVTVFHASATLELQFLRERLPVGRHRYTTHALERVLARYEHLSLANAARVIVLSDFSRDVLARRNAQVAAQAVKLPVGIDTERFCPGERSDARARLGIAEDTRLLLTVRRLVPRMGLENLIEAATLLGDEQHVEVAIVGGGPEQASLERRRAESGLGERLRLAGRVSEEQLLDWYRAADLFVLPTVAYEGFGLVTAEALACGTPVVGTPVGATPELLRPLDERLVATGTSPAALAAALRPVLRGEVSISRSACRSYALANFSWDRAIGAWEAELAAAAALRRRPPRNAVVRVGRAVDERVPFDVNALRGRLVAGRREVTSGAARYSGLPAVTRRLRAERRGGVLLYHAPQAGLLERHLEFLARRHLFIAYDTLVTAVSTGDWSEVPPKSLAVTFDDGHATNAGLVDLLHRFGIKPTIFLCTELVGTRRRFWWDIEGLEPALREDLMRVPDDERLETLERLFGWTPTREYPDDAQVLSMPEVAALSDRVDFQAHTRTHPILPMCDDGKATLEIAGSRTDVEQLRTGPCLDFAYPNGRYGTRELDIVRKAGFRSARTTRTGWNDPFTSPYELRVIGMPDTASINLVAAQSTGIRGLKDLMYLS